MQVSYLIFVILSMKYDSMFSLHYLNICLEIEYKDPALYYKVDIGFKPNVATKSEMLKAWTKQIQAQRADPELEKQALRNQCKFLQ